MKQSERPPLVIAALGGNALLQRGQALTLDAQKQNARQAAEAISALCEQYSVVVTHGNGPQIGLMAGQNQTDAPLTGQGLDVLGAESDALIGYILELELRQCRPSRDIATMLTFVEVRGDDPAFMVPSKPIGPWYTEVERDALSNAQDWTWVQEGNCFRRTVASPEPVHILELPAIATLVEQRILVICGGGGGIPVCRSGNKLKGVDAVIDKDLTTALLAQKLKADIVLFLTDVDGVYENWGQATARRLSSIDRSTAAHLALPRGSMAPKVEAALRVVETTGGLALIGHLADIPNLIRLQSGTRAVV